MLAHAISSTKPTAPSNSYGLAGRTQQDGIQPRYAGTPITILLGIFQRLPVRDDIDLRLRLRHRNVRLQAADYQKGMLVVLRFAFRSEGNGHPQLLAVLDGIEARRHDADHRIPAPVELQRASQNRRVGLKTPSPQSRAQDGDPLMSRMILGRIKRPAQHRCDPKHGKEVVGHSVADNALRSFLGCEVEAGNLGSP